MGVLAGTAASQEPPIYRASVEVVRLQVAVMADDDGPVPILGAEDFRVRENGRERPVTVVMGPGDAPLELVLAMDVSGSMSRWPSRRAYLDLLDSLDPAACVLLLPFREEVLPGLWGHPADPSLRRLVEEIELAGDEAIYDALIEAYRILRNRAAGVDPSAPGPTFTELMRFRTPGAAADAPPVRTFGGCEVSGSGGAVRRAVLVVADEPDERSARTLGDVLLTALGSDIPLFALAPVPRPSSSGAMRTANLEAMRTLAEHTGGVVIRRMMGFWDWCSDTRESPRRWNAGCGESLVKDMERLGRALRGHYVLAYTRPREDTSEGSFDEADVDVDVRRDDVDVMLTTRIARGRTYSDSAAMDLVLAGFRDLTAGDATSARAAFENAVALAPGIGLTHYSVGLAVAALGTPEDALQPLLRAKRLAPWLPDLDARIAEARLAGGDAEGAWQSILAAHAQGSDVEGLMERLRALAPGEYRLPELALPPSEIEVSFSARGAGSPYAGVAAQWLAPHVAARLARSIRLKPRWQDSSAPLRLELVVRDAKRNGRRLSAGAWLVLEDRQGNKHASEFFRIGDLDDEARRIRAIEDAFREIEAAVARLLEGQ